MHSPSSFIKKELEMKMTKIISSILLFVFLIYLLLPSSENIKEQKLADWESDTSLSAKEIEVHQDTLKEKSQKKLNSKEKSNLVHMDSKIVDEKNESNERFESSSQTIVFA